MKCVSFALCTFPLTPKLLHMKLIIGSRGSKLALWQAHWVQNQLTAAGYEIEIRVIKTTGDKLQAVAPGEPIPASMAQTVADAGSKGLFIKEIEEALLAREIDVAVHSLKDLPTVQPEGLVLAAVPRAGRRARCFHRPQRPVTGKLAPGRACGHQQLTSTNAIARATERPGLCRDTRKSRYAIAQVGAWRLRGAGASRSRRTSPGFKRAHHQLLQF